MKSISKNTYKLHSQHNLTDVKEYEYVSTEDKLEMMSELINYFEVKLLQYKDYDDDEIELMMLIDDDYEIKVEDETDEDKEKTEKVIHTLNTLTSMIEELSLDND